MQKLRTARTLAQVMFTWFVLTVCAASLAPVMRGEQRLAGPNAQVHAAAASHEQGEAPHTHADHHGAHPSHHAQHHAAAESIDDERPPAPPGDFSAHHAAGHGMECPLCLVAAPPSLRLPDNFACSKPAEHVVPLATRVQHRRIAAAPLPARGPPQHA